MMRLAVELTQFVNDVRSWPSCAIRAPASCAFPSFWRAHGSSDSVQALPTSQRRVTVSLLRVALGAAIPGG